jgi:hypothetical protein
MLRPLTIVTDMKSDVTLIPCVIRPVFDETNRATSDVHFARGTLSWQSRPAVVLLATFRDAVAP